MGLDRYHIVKITNDLPDTLAEGEAIVSTTEGIVLLAKDADDKATALTSTSYGLGVYDAEVNEIQEGILSELKDIKMCLSKMSNLEFKEG